MVKFLQQLNKDEITKNLRHFDIETNGTLSDMKITLEAEINKRYPELLNPSDFDFTDLLEQSPRDHTSSQEPISTRVQNIELLCIKLMEQLKNTNEKLEIIMKEREAASNSSDIILPSEGERTNPITPTEARASSNDQDKEFIRAKSAILPPFWKNEPELWFNAVETIFQINNITSETIKFGKVLSLLDCNIAKENSNLFKIGSESDSYATLKTQLIKMYQISNEDKMTRLFGECQLGDKKPSRLYREMTDLASEQMTKTFIILAWLKKLPTSVEQLLRAFHDKLSDDELINMADGMMKCSPNTETCALETSLVSKSLEDKIDKLITKLDGEYVPRSRSRSRTWSRSNYRSRNRSSLSPNQSICFYHKHFNVKARKCFSPCNFENQNSSGNDQAHR